MAKTTEDETFMFFVYFRIAFTYVYFYCKFSFCFFIFYFFLTDNTVLIFDSHFVKLGFPANLAGFDKVSSSFFLSLLKLVLHL